MIQDKKKSLHARRRFKAASLSNVASGLLAPSMRRKGFMQNEIVAKWAHIVGPELAAATVPLALKFPRGKRLDGRLTIRCTSAFAPLLQHRTPHVLDAINRYFGYGAVAGIYINQGPLPKPARRLPRTVPKKLSARAEADLEALVRPDPQAQLSADQQALADTIRRLGRAVLADKDAE